MPDPKVGDTVVVKYKVSSVYPRSGDLIARSIEGHGMAGFAHTIFKGEWCEVIPGPVQLYAGHTYNGRTIVWSDNVSVVYERANNSRYYSTKTNFLQLIANTKG